MDIIQKKVKRLFQLVSQEHDYSEIFKGALITFLLRFLSFLLIYILNFLIAKLYGAEGLGNYTLTVTFLDIGAVIALFGMDTAVVRLVSEYKSDHTILAANRLLYRTFLLAIPISILLGLAMWLISKQLAIGVFHNPDLVKVFHIVSLLLPPTVITRLYASAFRGRKKVLHSILFDMVGTRFGNLVLLLGLIAAFGLNDSYIFYSLAIAVWTNALLCSTFWHTNAKESHNCSVNEDAAPANSSRLKEIISLSLPLYLTASMYLIMGWTDTLMLGHFKNEQTVGIYSMVLKLSQLTNFSFISINMILLPKISELYWGHQRERLQKVVMFFTKIMFWGSLPVLIVLSLSSGSLLSLAGDDFSKGTVPLMILCVGQLVNCSTGSVISLLNMTGHQNNSRNVLVAACLVNVIGNFILVPRFGMTGAASATALSSIFRDLLASFYAYQIFRFRTWYVPFRIGKARFHKGLQ